MKANVDRVILKATDPIKFTKGGLEIPIQAQKVECWEVVSVGELSENCRACGAKKETQLVPGMLVLINENAGWDFSELEQDYRVILYRDIHIYDYQKS